MQQTSKLQPQPLSPLPSKQRNQTAGSHLLQNSPRPRSSTQQVASLSQTKMSFSTKPLRSLGRLPAAVIAGSLFSTRRGYEGPSSSAIYEYGYGLAFVTAGPQYSDFANEWYGLNDLFEAQLVGNHRGASDASDYGFETLDGFHNASTGHASDGFGEFLILDPMANSDCSAGLSGAGLGSIHDQFAGCCYPIGSVRGHNMVESTD